MSGQPDHHPAQTLAGQVKDMNVLPHDTHPGRIHEPPFSSKANPPRFFPPCPLVAIRLTAVYGDAEVIAVALDRADQYREAGSIKGKQATSGKIRANQS